MALCSLSRSIFLLLIILVLRGRHRGDERIFLDAVLVVLVEAALECLQLGVANHVTTVFADPLAKSVGAQVTHLVRVNHVEQALTIELELLALLLDLSIG